MTTFIAIGAFVVAVAIVARWWPGKTENDLVFDDHEHSLYECHNLTIWRYPQWGRPVILPGSKIQITNHRVIFSQKGLWSTTYALREIAAKKPHPTLRLKKRRFWGQVPIYELGSADFSIKRHNDEIRIIFTNRSAPNLQRMEITGVNSVEQFMQAVASNAGTASRRSS